MKSYGRFFLLCSLFVMLALLIFKPATYMRAASEGLEMFAVSVLPALFPFFFFTGLLTAVGAAQSLAKLTKKPTKILFGAPEVGGYVLTLSMISGYPIGAKLVAETCENGSITAEQAKRMIAYTSTSGPLFVIGTVGVNMFGDYKAGIIILLTHFAGAILNGIVFRGKSTECATSPQINVAQIESANLLADTVGGAVAAVLRVGGIIIIFNMVITALFELNVIGFLGSCLNAVGFEQGVSEGTLAGLIEVTKGAKLLADSGGMPLTVLPIVAALVSFGGASVAFQSLSFLSKCKIKAGYYLLTKLSHAVITYVLCFYVVLGIY